MPSTLHAAHEFVKASNLWFMKFVWNLRSKPDRSSEICTNVELIRTQLFWRVRAVFACAHDMCQSGYIDWHVGCTLSQALFQPCNLYSGIYKCVCVCIYIYRVEKSTANKQNRNSHRGTHTIRATVQYTYVCFAITTVSYRIRRHDSSNTHSHMKIQKLKLIYSDTFRVEWEHIPANGVLSLSLVMFPSIIY